MPVPSVSVSRSMSRSRSRSSSQSMTRSLSISRSLTRSYSMSQSRSRSYSRQAAEVTSALITSIRYELKDTVVAGITNNYADAELLEYINDAIEDLVQWIAGIWPQYWLRTGQANSVTGDITDGKANYDLPRNCYMVLAVAQTDSDDVTVLLDALEFERTFDSDADGYFLSDNDVWIYPTPDEDVTDGLTIYFIPRLTRVSATTVDLPGFTANYRGLIKEYVVIKCKARQEERSSDFAAIYGKLRDQLAAMIARTNLPKDASWKAPRRWWL